MYILSKEVGKQYFRVTDKLNSETWNDEGWCAIETRPWRVVRDSDLTLMKGGVRLYMT